MSNAGSQSRTEYHIEHMDCGAEEQMVRMTLDGLSGIRRLAFNLPQRQLIVYHSGPVEEISQALRVLNLNERLIGTQPAVLESIDEDRNRDQRRVLVAVFGINAAFFVLEIIFGLLSGSMGLVADSLDMLADAFVYALSLFAVGAAYARKQRIAGMSGWFQVVLAIIGLVEVVRRVMAPALVPDYTTMIVVAAAAAVANGASLYLLSRANSDEAHMKASWIFTSNDVIINIGVIVAGVSVYISGSRVPDLIVGTVVFLIVIRGAFRILALARAR